MSITANPSTEMTLDPKITDTTAHPTFVLKQAQYIDALGVQVAQYEHQATGAAHYHLASENSENVFLVALRTVPKDSTGVAHILEHTALCGSEKYPVRDPFFMMLRRSLNTFMNAFTSSDWTAYPFASQNRKDFNNLLDVYLDAVFFSRLDPLDFAQEGHRVEFSTPDDPTSPLVYKGVVFNEMKGAMSSITSTLWSTLCEHLFPTSTYHYNSGGDPVDIPNLSYEQLQAFYRSHYHPSNAIFMTFGDIPAAEHQSRFEANALSRFERLDQRIAVDAEQRLSKPLRIEKPYAFDEEGDTSAKTHLVMAWMLGESTDLLQMLEAQLLSSILLDNSASPLQHALETSELGRAPSPLCGLEDSMREMVFCCGLEGSEAEHADAFEAQVLNVLRDVADNGVEQAQLEAVLHQLELHQREVSGDGYPYGLQLILQALGCATHYSDPIAVLNLEPALATLRDNISDPDYIKGLAQALLLDNPHRVTLVMTPDTELSSRREEDERNRLAALQAAMTPDQQAATVQQAADLLTRQSQEDDEGILPKVELSDIPPSVPEIASVTRSLNGTQVTHYDRGTNGIVYQQAITALPQLNTSQLTLMPLFSSFMTEVGIGSTDYLETQQRQAATIGSISAFNSMRGTVDDEQNISALFTLSSKALLRKADEQTNLMKNTWHEARFDETDRLRELVSQQRARRDQAITGNGHGLAMAAACAGMSPLAKLQHENGGLAGIRSLRQLDEHINDPQALQNFADQLRDLHTLLKEQPLQLLTIAEPGEAARLAEAAANSWHTAKDYSPGKPFALPRLRESRNEMWVANTQVNFCARAYPTVPVDHSDAAALTVLGGVLRNGFLHRAIREQGGAYGGGASQDSSTASFRFYSYRDPRLSETLDDFDASIAWLLQDTHSDRVLEEAILGVIGSLDKPSSPAGEAKSHFHNSLFGRSHAQREAFRSRVLATSMADIQRVAKVYLQTEQASTAVITHAAGADSAASLREQLGMQLHEL